MKEEVKKNSKIMILGIIVCIIFGIVNVVLILRLNFMVSELQTFVHDAGNCSSGRIIPLQEKAENLSSSFSLPNFGNTLRSRLNFPSKTSSKTTLGQENSKTTESDLLRRIMSGSNGTVDDTLQPTSNDTGTPCKNLTTLRPWLEDYYKRGAVSAVYLLKLDPKFTYETCPKYVYDYHHKGYLQKATLNAAGKKYFGYGYQQSASKKMAAEEAIWDLYDKRYDYDFPDMDEYKGKCGI